MGRDRLYPYSGGQCPYQPPEFLDGVSGALSGGRVVAGSNPVTPTLKISHLQIVSG